MNEAQKNLRYVLPGLSSILVLLLTFLVSDFTTTSSFLAKVAKDNGLAIAFAALLGSGALGYLLANVYFALIWLPLVRRWAAVNHVGVINHLIELKRLKIDGYIGTTTKIRDQRQAWEMVNSFHCYHEVAPLDDRYKNLLDGLCNVTHALGATIIGLVLVIPSWCSVFFGALDHDWHDDPLIGILVLLSISVLICLLWLAYRRALLSSERIANSVFKEYILRNCTAVDPVRLVFLE